MRLHSYRDESHSRHFDLIGGGRHRWSIDLTIFVVGFGRATAHLGRDDFRRQDMDMRFLVREYHLCCSCMNSPLRDSARLTHAF